MATDNPIIGHWFQRPGGSWFEVVAIDEEAATVEIQQYDGTIDQIEFEFWPRLSCVEVAAPEDWSGSVDMDPEDYVGDDKNEAPSGYFNPLEFLDKD